MDRSEQLVLRCVFFGKIAIYRKIDYNIEQQKMGVNRLNPVQKATYFLKKNQKWEKMKNVQ